MFPKEQNAMEVEFLALGVNVDIITLRTISHSYEEICGRRLALLIIFFIHTLSIHCLCNIYCLLMICQYVNIQYGCTIRGLFYTALSFLECSNSVSSGNRQNIPFPI